MAVVALSHTPAMADALILGGGNSGATSDYAFAGVILPVFGATVGSGPALRLWGDYLDYSYTGGVGPVTASGWGGAIAGVYQFSGDWGWANASAGATFRDTRLSVFDPGNRQRGAHGYFDVQLDGAYNLDSAWRARGLASYTPTIQGYLTQFGIDRTVWGQSRLGATVTLQGDENYNEISAGLIGYVQLAPGLELDPGVGASHSEGKTSAYGSLVLVYAMN
jgi:hypothetical protein